MSAKHCAPHQSQSALPSCQSVETAKVSAFASGLGASHVPPPRRGDLPEIPPPPGDADAAGDEGAAP